MLHSRVMSLALAAAAVVVAGSRGALDLELMQLQAQHGSGHAGRRTHSSSHVGGPPNSDRTGASRGQDEAQDVIIVLQSDATDKEVHLIAQEVGGEAEGHPDKGELPFVKGRLSEASLESVREHHQGRLKYVETDVWAHMVPPNEEVAPVSEPSRLARSYPYNVVDVNAHLVRGRGAGVHVYVFDTGVRTTHTQFGGRAVPTLDHTSYSLVVCSSGDTSCANDVHGHGTHCAGTVAAELYGAADGATIHAVKVLDDSGYGYYSWIVNAQNWIIANGIRPAVLSMSLSGPGASQSVHDSIDLCVSSGITVVVAAGNDATDACGFSPSSVPSAITVGSYNYYYTSTRAMSSFSNYGSCIDVWAPGSSILSLHNTDDGALAYMSGTSMACPLVSGLMARVMEAYPSAENMTAAQRFALLTANNLTGAITGIPPSPASPNVVPLAMPASPCSPGDGSGPSGSYPCDCGSALCTTAGQVCSAATSVCATPAPSTTAPAPPTSTTAAAPPATAPSATGDPHLTNIYGQRFDLTRPGRRVLLHIPRFADAGAALLDVSAWAQRMGAACADLYFQELNVTGQWAEARQAGGFRFSAGEAGRDGGGQQSEWMSLGVLKLKVVHGRTLQGVRYLNFYVKNLGRVGMALGGLLGEDDHTAETAPLECAGRMALMEIAGAARGSMDTGSLAEASLE